MSTLPSDRVSEFTSTKKTQEDWMQLFGVYNVARHVDEGGDSGIVPSLIGVAKATAEGKPVPLKTARKEEADPS